MTRLLASAAVDFAYTAEDEAFRAELQTWLDANLPDFVDQGEIGAEHADDTTRTMARRQAWQRRLHEGRWAAINWPVEWGGREATTMQNVIYSEVMAQVKAPGIYNANGIWQIGPMIIRWGTDEQKQQWLPGILDATDHWCQGFTEPQAGSDLANLRTAAVADGDEYVLNGTKIWISTAHLARWGLFLVRTDPDAIARGAKHEGITALIVDMQAAGVQCNPIREITGEAMFDEVVFTDARVPVAYRLGGEGEGWTVAMGTLTHERVGTGGLAIGLRAELEAMIATAREHNPDALVDPASAGADRSALRPGRAHPAAQRPGAVEGAEGRAQLARGADRQAPVEPPLAGAGRAQRRPARPARAPRQGRAGHGGRRARGAQLPVAAVHLDRRRRHRGAEEHHRRPGHQAPEALSLRRGSTPRRR